MHSIQASIVVVSQSNYNLQRLLLLWSLEVTPKHLLPQTEHYALDIKTTSNVDKGMQSKHRNEKDI